MAEHRGIIVRSAKTIVVSKRQRVRHDAVQQAHIPLKIDPVLNRIHLRTIALVQDKHSIAGVLLIDNEPDLALEHVQVIVVLISVELRIRQQYQRKRPQV